VAAQRKKMQMKRRRKKRARAQEEEEKKKKKKKEEEEEEEEEETRRKRFSNLNQVPLTQRVMRHVFATSLLAPTPAFFVCPAFSEEEYKSALVMYLRQHGQCTLAKLGEAIKKPACVKKSLKKFCLSVKASHGKRHGHSFEVEGGKVHLIMKSNY
jgi:hypothetical protein